MLILWKWPTAVTFRSTSQPSRQHVERCALWCILHSVLLEKDCVEKVISSWLIASELCCKRSLGKIYFVNKQYWVKILYIKLVFQKMVFCLEMIIKRRAFFRCCRINIFSALSSPYAIAHCKTSWEPKARCHVIMGLQCIQFNVGRPKGLIKKRTKQLLLRNQQKHSTIK